LIEGYFVGGELGFYSGACLFLEALASRHPETVKERAITTIQSINMLIESCSLEASDRWACDLSERKA
jgi:hypothetical protein